jgi:transcription antitermination factor NusA-like protein
MKTPICDACARGEALCVSCQSKLNSGQISKLDIEVAQILCKINETHNLSAASFTRALDLGRVALILTDGEPGVLIGRGGSVVSALSSALGRKVRIVQFSGDVKKSIADIIAPARLLGINSVYVSGGEKLKVRIPRADLRALPVHIETLEPILKDWLGKSVELSFE